jgi:hypothetical protein
MVLWGAPSRLSADVLFFSGNLRTDANVTTCGSSPCTLVTDGDYAQWAAVVYPFTVNQTTTMEAITYSYGGGNTLSGHTVLPGGLEPYLSLFDSSGNFLASTFYGTTCPPGANSLGGNCFDVLLDGGTLKPGTYQIALSAFENMSFAENQGIGTLADGFTGLGNLEGDENLNYAFDVVLASNTPTPEPNAMVVLTIGCAALVFAKRRMRPNPAK